MYKRVKTSPDGIKESVIQRLFDNAFIPFAPDNTDYQKFKKDIMAGAELQDADGNTMTSQDAQAFIATLP